MGGGIRQIQRSNIATPLSQDVLGILQSQLRGGAMPAAPNPHRQQVAEMFGEDMATEMFGAPNQIQGELDASAFGTGVGPLQREAGTAIRQFVQSGGVPDALANRFGTLANREALNLREGMGAAGSRFGSSANIGEALLRSDIMGQLGAIGSQNMLSGIGMMQQFGNQNIAPFLQMAGQGILDPALQQKKGALGTLGDIAQIGSGVAMGLGTGGLGLIGPAAAGAVLPRSLVPSVDKPAAPSGLNFGF